MLESTIGLNGIFCCAMITYNPRSLGGFIEWENTYTKLLDNIMIMTMIMRRRRRMKRMVMMIMIIISHCIPALCNPH